MPLTAFRQVRFPGHPTESGPGFALNRRNFLTGAATGATAAVALSGASAQERAPSDGGPDAQTPRIVTLRINGQPYELAIDQRTSLLDTLRDHLRLTGTKKGCDHGQCGACTVHIDGQRQLSCMTFAVMAEGHEITTIEGLAPATGDLHPMQQAFIDNDAFQCGYCTPGQIMSAVGCVKEGHAGSEPEIREYMSGNLCRCAAYPNIVAAVVQARDAMKEG
ncbi:(2Fe-2S)-binding protein [Aurantimonas sp. VKM B-3413]|nr:(2Fe-2S)-binding protein [Aurantimonas sp. VKM B-3413]MCB8839677.1 (2Fe-2S)-binding protein [Aurantimonas sp. VKM B-3413]